ncbi:MAG: hypothetical protein U0Q16_03415 [Bryobacteraceae bacterium]
MNSYRIGHAVLLSTLTLSASAQIRDVAVLHGATFQPGLPARGSIASVFCKGLSVDGVVPAGKFPLPTELAGVRVKVGGTAAPLMLVANGDGYQQINFQVPFSAGNIGAVDAEVTVEQGKDSSSVRAKFLESPGEFFRLNDTKLYPKDSGVFQHVDDYSVVRLARGAKSGEPLIAYMTGLGSTTPLVAAGTAAPLMPPAALVENSPYITNTLMVGGKPAKILYIGLTPGLAGVYQINFVVPDLGPATYPVRLIRQSCAPIFSSCPNADSPKVESQPAMLVVN